MPKPDSHKPDSSPPDSSTFERGDYLKTAVREKAERDLAALETRRQAVDAVARAAHDVGVLAALLAQATPAIVATVADAAAIARLKKLRRALDDARVHADDLALAMDIEAERAEIARARAGIQAALVAAGVSLGVAPVAA